MHLPIQIVLSLCRTVSSRRHNHSSLFERYSTEARSLTRAERPSPRIRDRRTCILQSRRYGFLRGVTTRPNAEWTRTCGKHSYISNPEWFCPDANKSPVMVALVQRKPSQSH
ncbi:hypothetical protein BDW22DRAFT_1167256 [Trametopsis cervina]|nr:hypothetical protein BDW22DRAFT_1167256 [Trametopsis cervina]